MSSIEKQVEELAAKAVKTEKSEDAVRYAQAALNVAHAGQVLSDTKRNA